LSELRNGALTSNTVSRRAIATRAATAILGTAALTGCRFLEPCSDIGDAQTGNICIGRHAGVRKSGRCVVSDTGFEIGIGSVRVSGAAGVAPPGTPVQVTLAAVTVPADFAEMIRPVGQPVRVELGDGLQPSAPITITFDFTDVPLPSEVTAESPIVVMIQSESIDYNAFMEGTWNPTDRTFTVITEHLSLHIPTMPSITAFIGDFFFRLMGLRFGAPACAWQPLTTDLATYSIQPVSDASVLPCLQQTNGQIAVTVHSNTFLPWSVKSVPPVPGKVSGSLRDLGPGISAIYEEFFNALGDQRAGLMPGNAVTFRFSEAQPPTLIRLQLDPGLFLASTLLWQLQSLLSIFTWKKGLAAKVLKGFSSTDCFLETVDAQFEIVESQQFTGFVGSVLGCFGDFLRASARNVGGKLLEATVGVALLLLGGGVSLIATGIVGAYRTATFSDAILFRIESTSNVSTPAAIATQEPTPVPAHTGTFEPGQMVETNEPAIWVYSGPGLGYEQIWTSIITHEGEIIGGPVQADGYTWWQIRTQLLGDIWVQEEYLDPLD
jgi:hypothetical protein